MTGFFFFFVAKFNAPTVKQVFKFYGKTFFFQWAFTKTTTNFDRGFENVIFHVTPTRHGQRMTIILLTNSRMTGLFFFFVARFNAPTVKQVLADERRETWMTARLPSNVSTKSACPPSLRWAATPPTSSSKTAKETGKKLLFQKKVSYIKTAMYSIMNRM